MEDKKTLRLSLEKQNPWWTKEFKAKYKPRIIYSDIKKFMHLRHIIAFSGLRRAGKTTIMEKIIEDNISTYPKENIFYFSFDDSLANVKIMNLLDEYADYTQKDLRNEKFLILFDEVQKVDGWNEQLKVIYDLYPSLKIIVSGSESLFIRKKIRESLAGRMFEFHISQLKFSEFLKFREKKFDNLYIHREQILSEFKQFLICNGFPEIISENEEICEKYIKENVIEKILFKDLPQLVHIQDVPLLESILKIIINDPGQIINLEELASELKTSRQTLSNYIDYLEKSFLIKKIYNYSKNARKTQRKYKKYFPSINSFLLLRDFNSFGKLFETSIIKELEADYFLRDSYKNEVDIVKTEPLIAIEVKSGEIKERDLKPLLLFTKKFKPQKSLVISYDTEKEISGIKIIPFYKYLLK